MMSYASQTRITLVSICYNQEQYVIEALDSVMRGNLCEMQWIIVDDASTDNSVRLIDRWLDQHSRTLEAGGVDIEFVRHETNVGLVRTFNEALELTRGEYTCCHSCDDRLLPGHVEKSVARLEHLPESYACAYSDAHIINASGERVDGLYIAFHRQFEQAPEGKIFEALLQGNFICAGTVACRTEAIRAVDGYDALPCEDYDLWLRLARKWSFAFVSGPSFEYRFHEENLHKRQDWRDAFYWIYRKHIDHPLAVERYIKHTRWLKRLDRLDDAIMADIRSTELPNVTNWKIERSYILGEDGFHVMLFIGREFITELPRKVLAELRRFLRRL